MNYIRRGAGKPLLLLHGIGGSWRSWQTILDDLVKEREVIAIDLPGFGNTPPLPGPVTIGTLADAVTAFLTAQNLLGIDAVGSSMGARLVLELARRGGVLGTVVSLNPGGFWRGWEIPVFYHSVAVSTKLVRALQPAMPFLTGNAGTRTLLFAQFSAHPWQVPAPVALDEMRSFAHSPSFDELLWNLAYGEEQQGVPKGIITSPLVIGWGRQDRVCFPRQAPRALEKFPDASLYWFEQCGHFPQWDQPAETTRLILAATSGQSFLDADIARHAGAAAPTKRVSPVAMAAGVAGLVLGGIWLLTRKPAGAA
ncbi:alpha/beta fold hydrolase [Hymenobacter arizonensis]|uniref:Pimeloyl-ACP methyl ester carboxylesterase n=1 Tax=Hymenobacter arizonensis TaxID=1227077 RepID=A0A1I5V0W5_HYMAR|nr:alpha/beta fold hydrolase [Hymenobacter arizonensis]SFQ01121.1 Pimeloyl-ACP methyl ester carboxylesterase [Hymenobacter arizonensis]